MFYAMVKTVNSIYVREWRITAELIDSIEWVCLYAGSSWATAVMAFEECLGDEDNQLVLQTPAWQMWGHEQFEGHPIYSEIAKKWGFDPQIEFDE